MSEWVAKEILDDFIEHLENTAESIEGVSPDAARAYRSARDVLDAMVDYYVVEI